MAYDPTIQRFVNEAEQRWGNPLQNRELLYPYGIKPLDMALYGLDVINGELIIVQGEEKQRKTTLVENIIINGQLYAGKHRPLVVIDMLESGMRPEKYFDTLVANLASRILVEQGHNPNPTLPCEICSRGRRESVKCQELVLSHKFLRYNTRTERQKDAIKAAMDRMNGWKMHIYGPREEEGDTRNLEASITGTKDQKSRWVRLCEEHGSVIFVSDHLQQYSVPGTDYEKMLQVVPAHANVVATRNAVVFSITQVSMTSAREAASGMGKFTAAGGRKAAQEGNTIISTGYVSGQGKMAITVEDSRDAGSFSLWQHLEENSGAFHGESMRVNKLEFRPGMATGNGNGGNGNNRR